MSPLTADQCRARADRCSKEADAAERADDAAAWRDLAENWLRLAEQKQQPTNRPLASTAPLRSSPPTPPIALNHIRPKLLDCHRTPSFKIAPPSPHAVPSLLRWNQAGKNRFGRVCLDDMYDIWKDAFRPRRFPFRLFHKHPLHKRACFDRAGTSLSCQRCRA
jgi:hypothetical protein